MKKFTFEDCGCSFEILSEDPFSLKFEPDINKIPLDCSRTWNLISSGLVKGCFQLESHLGQHFAKALKPQNIEQLAALNALLRPGPLESKLDGKSLTEHYIDRKNGKDEIKYFHPSLKNALEKTYGILVFQESALQITVDVAGFNLTQAELLRKAIGKKRPEKMAQVKKQFIEGTKQKGVVNEQEAEEIFSWIESAQRYSFNKCLCPKTTYVEKPNNILIPLKDIKIGNYIKCPVKNHPYKHQFCKVKNIYHNGQKELYEYKFWGLEQPIRCTKDHKFLCKDGIIRSIQQISKKHNVQYYKQIFDRFGQEYEIDGQIDWGDVKYIGLSPTIDIEVNNDEHLFYANGIATSNSHSVSYAMNTYLSAYCKAHFKRAFYTSYLYYAKDKQKPQQEINEIINDTRRYDLEILPPSIMHLNSHFKLIDKKIYFGLSDIKGVGKSAISKLQKHLSREKINTDKITWLEFLVKISQYVNSKAITALISVGSLSHLKILRSQMLYEFEIYSKLSSREQSWCEKRLTQFSSLTQLLENLSTTSAGKDGGCANKNRVAKIEDLVKQLQHPPHSLKDSPEWVAGLEESLLGISLTHSSVESCNIEDANCNIKEFLTGNNSNPIIMLPICVDEVREIKTKKGKNPGQKMAFVEGSDLTGKLSSIVVFPDVWLKCKSLLVQNNHVMLRGKRGDQKKDSFLVENVLQI